MGKANSILKPVLIALFLPVLVSCLEKTEKLSFSSIVFVDKDGIPFSGFNFYLESAFHQFLTTDQDGVYQIGGSGNSFEGLGEEYWWYPTQSPGNDFVGWEGYTQPTTLEDLGDGNYKVTLSRVLQSDGVGQTYFVRTSNGYYCTVGAANCVASNTKYLAEAFIASTSMDICYAGIGGHSHVPNTVGISSNSGGVPGTVMASGAPIRYGLAVLSPSMGAAVTADFCSGGSPAIHLTAGSTYWIVATHSAPMSSIPSLFNYQGSSLSPASGLPLLQSVDGVNWTSVPTLNGGVHSLLIYVAQ